MSRFGDLIGGAAPAPEPVVEQIPSPAPEPAVEEVVSEVSNPVELKPPAPYKSAKKALRRK